MRGLVFEQARTIADVGEVFQKNVDKISFLDSEFLHNRYQSLIEMKEEKQEKFLGFVHHVDKAYSPHGDRGYLHQKLLTVLAGALYYEHFYDLVSDYNDEEFLVLAKYSFLDPDYEFSYLIERFPRSILSLISTKAHNVFESDDLILWYDYSLEKGVSSKNLETRLQEEDFKTLQQESFLIQDKIIKEMEVDENRRI